MQRAWMYFGLAAALLTVTGCAAFDGSPDRSSDPARDLNELAQYFSPESSNEYGAIPDSEPQEKRIKRDEIINGRVAAIDIRFNLFQQDLYQEGIGLNVGTDAATIGLGTAGALVSGGASQGHLCT